MTKHIVLKKQSHNCICQFQLGLLLVLLLALMPTYTLASDAIPMHDKGANTFYINGSIRGLGPTEFMVDTGSGYTTINQNTLEILLEKGEAIYVKQLTGILADGQRNTYPVYRIASIQLGESCVLHGVEAAVFPGNTRHILGLSALKKAGEFTFAFTPPQLRLSNCEKAAT
jgi:predicted aspartyl protease